jgi:hypothetical protein
VLLYLWGSFTLIKASILPNSPWQSLNDVFYWNQLPQHLNAMPSLATADVVANIQPQYMGYYLMLALVGCVVSLLLWLPGAIWADRRETRSLD